MSGWAWVEGAWELRRGTAQESHATSRCFDAAPDTLKREQRATSSPSQISNLRSANFLPWRAIIRVHSCPFVVPEIVCTLASRLFSIWSLADAGTEVEAGGDLAFLWLAQALWGRCPHLQGPACSGAVGSMPPPTGNVLFRCCGVDGPTCGSVVGLAGGRMRSSAALPMGDGRSPIFLLSTR